MNSITRRHLGETFRRVYRNLKTRCASYYVPTNKEYILLLMIPNAECESETLSRISGCNGAVRLRDHVMLLNQRRVPHTQCTRYLSCPSSQSLSSNSRAPTPQNSSSQHLMLLISAFVTFRLGSTLERWKRAKMRQSIVGLAACQIHQKLWRQKFRITWFATPHLLTLSYLPLSTVFHAQIEVSVSREQCQR